MAGALVVIDVLNRYDHVDAGPLARSAQNAVPQIARLVAATRARSELVVYVNDNHGDWNAGRGELSAWARAGARPDLIEPIAPDESTPLLIKARHSGFYATQLEYLLRDHGVDALTLAGQVTEQCILYTALDAYIRHFQVTIPRDAVAHIDRELADAALCMVETNMRGRIATTDELLA